MKGKGNDGTGNNQQRDLWQTSQELYNKLKKQYGFNFDCCANEKNTKCFKFSDNFETITRNNLGMSICWMNPPFSKAKEMFEHYFKVVTKGVAIFRCDNMETKVWQDIILKNASWILIPKGRINYDGMQGNGSRFPSALIGYNVCSPKNIDGIVLEVHKND